MSGLEIPLLTGGGLMAYGAIQQGKAQKKMHDYNAAQLRQNAIIEQSQGNLREEAQRRKASQVAGQQAAAIAQSGGGMGGSAADIMRESAINAELDAMTIRYESELKSKGLKNQAAGEQYAGEVARQAGYYNAIGSVLNTGATYAGLAS